MATETKDINKIKGKLVSNLVLFGKVCMPNMFSSAYPEFHYKIAKI